MERTRYIKSKSNQDTPHSICSIRNRLKQNIVLNEKLTEDV